MNPNVAELCVYDLTVAAVPAEGVAADISHINTAVKCRAYAFDKVEVPVIGGHAGTTILPLFSQDEAAARIPAGQIPDLDTKVQNAGTEVVKAKGGKGSATLSMAYAGARLGKAVLSGLAGVPVTECAYVESSVQTGLPYFASKVVFGKSGVEKVLPIGSLSEHEKKRLEELTPILKGEIDDGLEYAN